MKKVIYISSPYSIGNVEDNVQFQIEAAHRIMDMGHAPVVPLLSHFLHLHKPRPYDDWLCVDLALIEKVDIVLRLPGESKGADMEVDKALRLCIPVAFGWGKLDGLLR